MLEEEIAKAQRRVRTDAYPMSVGEIVGMYENKEISIDPEFQRLFRWSITQKSRLFESLLLGIPLPSIFVFENEDGTWELIDGLQRLSTILEFMGKLRSPDGAIAVPSILEATKYLPSLHNAVWEQSDLIPNVPRHDQREIEKKISTLDSKGTVGPRDIETTQRQPNQVRPISTPQCGWYTSKCPGVTQLHYVDGQR